MVRKQLEDGAFGIKLVWPGYIEDDLADRRVGFPADYDKKYDFPINAKMLIYVTEYQAIVAVNQVTGTWDEGKRLYKPRGRFPICLPIKETFRSKVGLSKKEVQQIIPRFTTYEGLSFFPLSEGEFIELEKALIQRG